MVFVCFACHRRYQRSPTATTATTYWTVVHPHPVHTWVLHRCCFATMTRKMPAPSVVASNTLFFNNYAKAIYIGMSQILKGCWKPQ